MSVHDGHTSVMGNEAIPPAWLDSHFQLYGEVPAAPARIGYAELQKRLQWGHRNRVKRTVSTLVGLEVLAWQGMRNGRAVSRGSRTLAEAVADGLQPMPEREFSTYPLLLAPIDEFITRWHTAAGDPIDTRLEAEGNDGVTVYPTWGRPAGPGTYTRPDLTAIVDLQYPSLGPWNDIHAIEVKPYWSLDRTALFEAIAQASLRRCTFSWLVAWVPAPDSGHFTAQQQEQIVRAQGMIGTPAAPGTLAEEAATFGIGLALARDLSEDAAIDGLIEPHRRTLDPAAADDLFQSLGRTDSLV